MLCDITKYHAVTLSMLFISVASWQPLCFGSEGGAASCSKCLQCPQPYTPTSLRIGKTWLYCSAYFGFSILSLQTPHKQTLLVHQWDAVAEGVNPLCQATLASDQPAFVQNLIRKGAIYVNIAVCSL